ncbi:MAG: DEAD/DEAH box helicase family protein [Anaerolineaceae bacterium]|nr:DEAD/DEAH box helicase family protein [Anaerolineaceae bacterium]
MPDAIIENPIINSPFTEPKRHFFFNDQGITNQVIDSRRKSSYFIPIPKPKKKNSQQVLFETEWTQNRVQENDFINRVRDRVRSWRMGGYVHVTNVTRRLLDYWTKPARERKLFFCQIEAVETAIYLTEVARDYGDNWIEERIKQENESANHDLFRIAFKMATGSGKTLVMAMLIAWQTLNKAANAQDNRFNDAFLVVTPGITIRDRLRVLMPNDPENYYRLHDLVPPELMQQMQKAKIIITNFHAFKQREQIKVGKLTKAILEQNESDGVFLESPEQMVRRVCRELGTKKNIVVINDEAHHCYRHKAEDNGEKLSGDDREEAKEREEQARIWISGLEAVKEKLGIKVVYDLSATPFFLKGSGYPEGTLFGWVVSDFSLIDAIESGIVKVPRVPISDDSMAGTMPVYRNLWVHIRDELPKKGRGTEAVPAEPRLPIELEGALTSLYSNYQKTYEEWEKDPEAIARGSTPPVFIVVCNNTNVSQIVYNYISGWRKVLSDGTQVLVPGKFSIFSNVENNRWLARPNTILVDSQQLDSGESLSPEFKAISQDEIEQFKSEYRIRFPGRDPDALTDADLLREVMNTVGKRDRLGEQIRCVVSVSMLTEGWDASTVTHILGVRAFGTQLLCEQVIGRGLRRMSHATTLQEININGKSEMIEVYEPEYAEVYGVPFSFIPCAGGQSVPKPTIPPTRVRALEERLACEITFPKVIGYRYILPDESVFAEFTDESRKVLSTEEMPSKTEMASILGEGEIHKLDDLLAQRIQEVDFLIASRLMNKYFMSEDGDPKPWLFPSLLKITREWRENYIQYKDNCFPQMLLLVEHADDAVEKIYRAIVHGDRGNARLLPILAPYDQIGSTRYVDFDTTQPVYSTRADRCHVSHVVGDTGTWEQKVAQSLEDMPEVIHYVKNERLGFSIPYSINGEAHEYNPDFIVRIDDGHGRNDLLNLVLEVSGREKKEKKEKVATTRTLWVPAINTLRTFGRWAFHETSDPWNVMTEIRDFLHEDFLL